MSIRTTKWRWQEGHFKLIGLTDVVVDTLASEKGQIASITRDANLSTLKMTEEVETVTGQKGEEIQTQKETVNCDVPNNRTFPQLKDFSDVFESPVCSDKNVE
jgi:hypothetical protein